MIAEFVTWADAFGLVGSLLVIFGFFAFIAWCGTKRGG